MSNTIQTLSLVQLSHVSGGAPGDAPAPAPAPPVVGGSDFAPVQGNVVQQGAQMIDNAAQGWAGARKAGASWYEALGNATIGGLGLGGGFAPNGRPR